MGRRKLVFVVGLALAATACGGSSESATTTTAASTTTAVTTTSTTVAPTTTVTQAPPTISTQAPATTTTAAIRPESAWYGSLTEGACFDDVYTAEGQFDFSVPPMLVDCAGPHDNEIVALPLLGGPDDPFPAADELGDLVVDICTLLSAEFFGGRTFEEVPLDGFFVWPDAIDWESGVRTAVCAVFGADPLVGTARSGSLDAAPATAAVLSEEAGQVDVWLIDTATGELLQNLTDDAFQELLNPVAWSPDGARIAYGTAEGDDIWILDLAAGGPPEPLLSGTDSASSPDFSPDGSRMLYVSDAANTGDLDIIVYDIATGTELAEILGSGPDRESSPEYSPDGSSIVFRGRSDGNSDIYVMDADGSNVVRLTDDPAFDGDPTWTPDGEHIVFISDRTGDYDIYIMRADGSDVVNLTNHPANDEYPDVVPTGDRIAFHSDRLGGTNVWVMRLDGSDQSLLTASGPTGYVSFAPAG
jgi:TolB protein